MVLLQSAYKNMMEESKILEDESSEEIQNENSNEELSERL